MVNKHIVPDSNAFFSAPDPFDEFMRRRTPQERVLICARFKQSRLNSIGVRIQCIDSHNKEVAGAYASGFIKTENKKNYLYTCWHVVSGYGSPLRLNVKTHQNRNSLRILTQLVENREKHLALGGVHQFDIPLYDENNSPLWLQEDEEQEQPDLNAIGLRVPRSVDVIRIEIPPDIQISPLTLLNEQFCSIGMLPGNKISIVGYPHGYSADGEDEVTAIALTRHVAAMTRQASPHRFLIDGPGTPGMSGAPVFAWDKHEHPHLLGIYAGIIHPGAGRGPYPEHSTSLGECFLLCHLYNNKGLGLTMKGGLST